MRRRLSLYLMCVLSAIIIVACSNSNVVDVSNDDINTKVNPQDKLLMIGKSMDEVIEIYGQGSTTTKYPMESENRIKYDDSILFFEEDTDICYGVNIAGGVDYIKTGMTLELVKSLYGYGTKMVQIIDGKEVCFVQYLFPNYEVGSNNETKPLALQLYSDINSNITDVIAFNMEYAQSKEYSLFVPKEEKVPASIYEFPVMDNPDYSKTIDFMCKYFYEENNLMGLSVGVLVDGEVSYYNYGLSKEGGDPITENSIFEIASLTKTFTGIMLSDLELEGKLSKTDPAQKFLEGKAIFPKYGEREITLQNLATHSSDLSRNPYNLFDDFETEFDNEYANLTIEDVYEALDHEYIRYEPGTSYTYSNFAFGLLGDILCKIEGKTYDEILEERITSVLGMKNTRCVLTKEQEDVRTTGHNKYQREMVNFHFGALEGCGSIKSTTSDMIRYLAANLEILDSKLAPAIKEAHEVHFIGDGKTVGLGWHMFNLNGDIVYDHNGITPGYRSSILLIKDKGVGVVIMTNTAFDLNDFNIEMMSYLQNIEDTIPLDYHILEGEY